jgi:hypothetical protein
LGVAETTRNAQKEALPSGPITPSFFAAALYQPTSPIEGIKAEIT